MKEVLILKILGMLGVVDLEGINHVKIEVTPSKFHVYVKQNAHSADRSLWVEDSAIVQQIREFDIIERSDE